jgi:ADP-ribosylglycohydrolase
MNEVGTSTARDNTDAVLSNAVLVMSICTAKRQVLPLGFTVSTEFSRSKDTIVSEVTHNSETSISGIIFGSLLSKNGLFSCQVSLRIVKDFSTGMIDVEGTSNVSILVSVTTEGVETATTI